MPGDARPAPGPEAPVDLPLPLWRQMIDQARAESPYEACGLVAGDAAGRALRYHPMRNAAGRLDWFEPDPMELLRLTMAIEGAAETVWGIYHSHPRSPARPSESDVEAAGYPDSLYLISSLQDGPHPVLRAFRIQEGQVTEVPLRLREPAAEA